MTKETEALERVEHLLKRADDPDNWNPRFALDGRDFDDLRIILTLARKGLKE